MSAPQVPTARLPLPGPFVDDPAVAAILDQFKRNGMEPINLTHMLGYAPGLITSISAFTTALRTGIELSEADRELVILRTGVVARGAYEVAQHVTIAKVVGVDPAQIADIGAWRTSSAYTPHQRALLAYIDASLSLMDVDAAVFAELSRYLNLRQIVEATILSGAYAMLSQVTRALEIPVDALSAEKLSAYRNNLAKEAAAG